MIRKYKFHDNDKLYFISFATIHWIDVFVREEYSQIVIDSWVHCQEKKGLQIYGWCIPDSYREPSHVHMIIGSKKDKLEDIVRDMKKHTSSTLKVAIKNNNSESRKEWIVWTMERAGKKNGNNKDWHPDGYRDWQQHNQPLEITNQEMFDKTLDYIHQNPVVAGFVIKPEDWKYSSAKVFCGGQGLVALSYC